MFACLCRDAIARYRYHVSDSLSSHVVGSDLLLTYLLYLHCIIIHTYILIDYTLLSTTHIMLDDYLVIDVTIDPDAYFIFIYTTIVLHHLLSTEYTMVYGDSNRSSEK